MKVRNVIIGAAIGVCAVGTSDALNICMKKGSFVGVVKKSVNGTSSEYDGANKRWKVSFDYTNVDGTNPRVMTGIAACNDVSGTVGVAETTLVTTTTDVGRYCWCKMEPVSAYQLYNGYSSWWVLHSDYGVGNESDCSATGSTGCAAQCANDMKTDLTFRSAIFNAMK